MHPRAHPSRRIATLLVCLWIWPLIPGRVAAEGPEASAGERPKGADEAVVARVGETVFTLKDIRTRLGELAPPYRYAAERRLPEVVKEIVEREMLWREARRLDLDKDPDIQRQIEDATKQILIRALFMREVRARALPSDGEVRRYYADHPAEFSIPERQEEQHLLVQTEAEAEAILAEVREGKDFEALARTRSQDQESEEEDRGLVFTRGQRDAEIERVAFGMNVGEVGGPVRTPQGYLVIKVTSRQPASSQPLDMATPAIQARLQPQNEKRLFEALLNRIRVEQNVEIREDLLRAAMLREGIP